MEWDKNVTTYNKGDQVLAEIRIPIERGFLRRIVDFFLGRPVGFTTEVAVYEMVADAPTNVPSSNDWDKV